MRPISFSISGGQLLQSASNATTSTALLMTVIGLYGVISSGVTQRTREIGIRAALGARRRDVLFLILRDGLRLIGAGLVAGLAVVLLIGGVLSGLLFGVAPHDPIALAIAAVMIVVAGVAATWLPARRAAAVEPIVALRSD